jgi:hypothetical protein
MSVFPNIGHGFNTESYTLDSNINNHNVVQTPDITYQIVTLLLMKIYFTEIINCICQTF